MGHNYLDELNPQQKEAVVHTEGPCMIIAGAGSGKTKVLTYRIAYLMEQGVDPFNILALTFTNKASREMRERIETAVGTEARNLWMGTFHSVFAKILRAEGKRLGYTSDFTIYDTDDSKSLIKTIVKELNLDEKLYKANTVFGRISELKNKLISSKDYWRHEEYQMADQEANKPHIGKIYQAYAERCFKANAMDFDDLLFNTNILFRDYLDVLNKYQNKFHYVLVDEFQDTNLSQYLITRKLAAKNQNITVVGDDAQSIYGFRGADIQNILNFEKDYPDLKVFKLEQNYRSTKNIINAANSIINNNKAQLKKEVWTNNGEGDPIHLYKATSDGEEGKMIANAIFEDKMNHNLRNKDFAILYRTNAQSRSLEEALRKININYRIYGGLSFYQRKEIKDLIAYFRLTVNPDDEEALKRVINYPKRGIGQTTFSKILIHAHENNTGLWKTLENARSLFSGNVASAIENFVTLIKRFSLETEKRDAYEAGQLIAKESGILKELYDDKTVEGLTRYENLQELLNGIKEYVDNPEHEDKSLSGYLQNISLLTGLDTEDDDDDKVTLMTIHSAKGLEFNNVYISGLEEDLFPSQLMLNSRADLEEERRLFYVAVTRAKSKLTLSYAQTRYRFGRLKSCEASRFVDEIDPRYLYIPKKAGSEDPYTQSSENLRQNVSNFVNSRKANKKHEPSKDFTPSDASKIETGMKVEHPKFGYGVVTFLDKDGNSKKAKVDFEGLGEKTLLLSFAKLRIVEP